MAMHGDNWCHLLEGPSTSYKAVGHVCRVFERRSRRSTDGSSRQNAILMSQHVRARGEGWQLPTKGRKKNSKKPQVEFTKVFTFKQTWNGHAQHDWRLWRKKGSDGAWLHIDDVPSLIEYLHDERLAYGVPVEQDVEASSSDDDDSEEASENHDNRAVSSIQVTFDRRDLSWQAKVKGATTGIIHRLTRCVPMKNQDKKVLTPIEFEAMKAEIQREVQAWAEKKQHE